MGRMQRTRSTSLNGGAFLGLSRALSFDSLVQYFLCYTEDQRLATVTLPPILEQRVG